MKLDPDHIDVLKNTSQGENYKCPYELSTNSSCIFDIKKKPAPRKANIYQCEQCQYSSKSISELFRHKMEVHDENRQYKCHVCNYSAGRKYNLQEHIKFVHTGQKTYKCSLCNFCASTKSKLKSHNSAVHEKCRPHLCE